MNQTCTKCNKVVKAFQRVLVYEPVKEPCKMCDRQRPYPSAPPFGTTIKVCSFGEMERMCFPKLCDCPCREIPLCPDALRRERICRAIYWLATFALFAYLFDSGIFRHPVHTTRLTDTLKEMIGEMYTKEQTNEEKDEEGKDAKRKEAKGNEGSKEGKPQLDEPCKDRKREYDRLTKTYNVANVWNAAVIIVGDVLITAVKLPKYVFVKTLEAISAMNEEDAKTGDKTKAMSHEKKGEAKEADGKKPEAKKDEPKKEDDKKQEAKKDNPKKEDSKKEAKN